MTKVVMLKPSMKGLKGGLEKSTRYLAEKFAQEGSEVIILTTGEGRSWNEGAITYVPLCHRTGFSAYDVAYFDRCCQKWLKQYPSKIVFGMERNSWQTHYRAGSGVHRVFLQRRFQEEGWLKRLSLRLNPLQHLLLSLEKQAFEHPDLRVLFTNSDMVKKEILSLFSIDPHKLCVVHNGVAFQQSLVAFENWTQGRHIIDSRYSLPQSCFRWLFIGHGYKRKGLSSLLKALSHMKHLDFHLCVAGKEKKETYYQLQAFELGLEKKVSFMGQVDDPTLFYQWADGVVIPSFYDPFANVTVEALSMGVRVVTSSYNGGKEVLNKTTGCVVEDILDEKVFADILSEQMKYPKTQACASLIRTTVEHLDYENQMKLIIKKTLEN